MFKLHSHALPQSLAEGQQGCYVAAATALLLRQSYLHTHIPSQSVFVCRHACIIHIGGFVDLRVEACIEEIFQSCCCVSLHGHLQACRGTLQPDSSVHHMMSVKRPTTLNPRRKAGSLGVVNAEAFRFISSALVLCRQADALHEVGLHASCTAAVLIGVHTRFAKACHRVCAGVCMQVPCHVWGRLHRAKEVIV